MQRIYEIPADEGVSKTRKGKTLGYSQLLLYTKTLNPEENEGATTSQLMRVTDEGRNGADGVPVVASDCRSCGRSCCVCAVEVDEEEEEVSVVDDEDEVDVTVKVDTEAVDDEVDVDVEVDSDELEVEVDVEVDDDVELEVVLVEVDKEPSRLDASLGEIVCVTAPTVVGVPLDCTDTVTTCAIVTVASPLSLLLLLSFEASCSSRFVPSAPHAAKMERAVFSLVHAID